MKKLDLSTVSRTLPVILLALLALMALQVFARTRVVSIERRSPEAQATPTPFPCQPLPASCPAAPVTTVNSPQVPCDVCLPSGFNSNGIAFFDDYSWRSFIALVWPALNGQRGVPDPNQTVGGSGPRVFETYKGLWEVFHTDGSAPSGWNDFDPPAMNACGVQSAFGDLVLASFSKFSDLGQAGFGSLLGPLVAQNTTYVSYLTAYNQSLFDQITSQSNQWYLRKNLPASITFANGSLDVKSAWMDMTNAKHPERYYTRMAWVMDPASGKCSQKTVGLVGLHIVQKTPTRPQWIWSTFEQVDNVPPPQAGAPGTFGFNDGSGKAMPSKNPYPINPLTIPVPPPFNVTRTMPISTLVVNGLPSTVTTNANYQQALKSQGSGVWQYYQLVMTQWPVPGNTPTNSGNPNLSFPGNGANSAFSNTVLETFEQGSIGTGCMACHTVTQKATDFLWSLSDHAFPPKIPSLLLQDSSFRNLRDLIEGARKNPNLKPKAAPKPNKK